MIAVITGDIIGSESISTEIWLSPLKKLLSTWGEDPRDWEIYRGDEFQLRSPAKDVFQRFLAIKSLIKSLENLDVRVAIGLGEENFSSSKITESNGSAYVNSGRLLNKLKSENKTFALDSDDPQLNEDLGMLFRWVSLDFDSWTPALAQIVHESILYPKLTQEEIAQKLSITQSSVSQRARRANLELITETDKFFQRKISQL